MSHYFSIVRLERGALTHRDTRDNLQRLLRMGTAYFDHCLMMRLFPALRERFDSTRQEERSVDFLFHRCEQTENASHERHNPQTSWYVVSQEQPVAVPGLLQVQTKPYQPALREGDLVRFRLRANPSVTRSRGGAPGSHGGKRRPQHDVLMLAKREAGQTTAIERSATMDAAAAAWLLERAPSHGLLVEEDALFMNGYTQHRGRRKDAHICFSSIDYTGVARVTDSGRLTSAMLHGIGRKRSFGCGLLLVRRFD